MTERCRELEAQLEALHETLESARLALDDGDVIDAAAYIAAGLKIGDAPEPDCYEGNVAANIAGGRYP